MTDKKFKMLCQQIIDAKTEKDLLSASQQIDAGRKTTDFRDFAIFQSLVLQKGNEFAIMNILDAMAAMELTEESMMDAPSFDERH